MALLRCPVCGGHLRNERHLHAEVPEVIFGRAVNPDLYEVGDNTIEARDPNVYDYSEGEPDADQPQEARRIRSPGTCCTGTGTGT